MRAISIALMVLAVASCEGHESKLLNKGEFVPTGLTALSGSIQIISPTIVTTLSTPPCQSFTIGFALVVSPALPNSSLDTVTIHLIDGSNLGGPEITFPRAGLANMFGSTSLVGTSSFTFQSTFACVVVAPVAITTDAVVVDGTGGTQILTTTASLK
jgi:hypothetical protein